MSRSSRPTASSSATITQPIHPPLDHDIVMGPPPLPTQIAPALSAGARSKDGENQDVAEKYRRLKRKYFELEEKHKDTVIELRGSGERAVQMRSERNALLDRIVELEAMTSPGQHPPPHPLLPYPTSTAYPRSLNNPLAQKRLPYEPRTSS
ncbi:hypothetical protein NM688_g2126 [Phlebia brevispora]|uniref:Uncharacterized protein n=1 Tax=Phlebia brevispora TaxID=194682 RepID=A0ACC1T9D7_9APHY|nr:hypothetical protein NM688_g2126 [Phlebia brevispora]